MAKMPRKYFLEEITLLCPQCKSIDPNIFVRGWLEKKLNKATCAPVSFALSED